MTQLVITVIGGNRWEHWAIVVPEKEWLSMSHPQLYDKYFRQILEIMKNGANRDEPGRQLP